MKNKKYTKGVVIREKNMQGDPNKQVKKMLFFFGYSFLLAFVIYGISDAHAISVDSLRAPMQDLKKEVFSWMFAVKIASAAVGGAFALAKQSLTPFGVGAGIAAGIHFFDKWIGDGSAALIG